MELLTHQTILDDALFRVTAAAGDLPHILQATDAGMDSTQIIYWLSDAL